MVGNRKGIKSQPRGNSGVEVLGEGDHIDRKGEKRLP